MRTLIDLNNVIVKRNGNTLLDSVSWTTHLGEHWVILGPNGAGKTSLVRTVLGREIPSAGSMHFTGTDIQLLSPAEINTRIGFASQSQAIKIAPSQLVKSVILTAAWGQSKSYGEDYNEIDEKRVNDLMALFGVYGLRDRAFYTLSEGERQRVLLARSLMPDPEILILDEPSAGLDLAARELLLTALEELLEGAVTTQIILITHQLDEISEGFTHAVLLSQGKITAAGPIEKTLTDANISQTFNLNLQIQRAEGRWDARYIR